MNAVSTENNKSITPNLRRFGSLMFFIVLCFAVAATGIFLRLTAGMPH